MQNEHNASTEEEIIEEESAKEGRIDPLDLAMQIHPLLDDYFCGTFVRNTKGVLMKMNNGQVFQLKVEEVA